MINKTKKGDLHSWAGNPRDESRRMKLKIVCPDKSLLPTRVHEHDAGLDLRCAHKFGVILAPGERRLIDTGVKVAIPAGYVGLVHPRSGWAHKYGITVNNAPGTVDAGYAGNVRVNLINHGDRKSVV